jgi:TLD
MSHAKTKHLGVLAFRQQCERFLAILDDSKIVEMYVRIFCLPNEENASKEGVKLMLRHSFNIAMAFYLGDATTCPLIEQTLDAIIATCFFQEPLSIGFIARWLEENCPRLILPIHRYVVHILTTSYRSIKMNTEDQTGNGLELATPVLEKGLPFGDSLPMLTLSMAWLLAGTLPPSYSKPQALPAPKDDEAASSGALSPTSSLLPSQSLLSKLVGAVPSHWTLLYDTRQHGVGANRFLHHVLGYRGPNLVVIKARSLKDDTEKIYCVASPNEWRETNLYVGGEDSCLIQLQPKFAVMEKGAKILYLNTHIRGYPKGFRVAVDPRNPIIAIDEQFEKLDVHSIAHTLVNIEVWGCGDKSSRDVQLDIKKWQIKEAERQRTVKLTAADWIDNPDRYLLELGGRPQYNNSSQ